MHSAKRMVIVGADHRGVALKTRLLAILHEWECMDIGMFSGDVAVDYPDVAVRAALLLKKLLNREACGILICGSGNGMAIAANRFPWIRCIVATDLDTVIAGRQHNDANMIAIGADNADVNKIILMVRAFLSTPFIADERHVRRISKMSLIGQEEFK